MEIKIFFHFEKLIEKCYALKEEMKNGTVRKTITSNSQLLKLVEDEELNQSLLDCTLEEVDTVSRSVQYDLRRKLSFFKMIVKRKETTGELFNRVQKYVHMIELYHINLHSNLTDIDDKVKKTWENASSHEGEDHNVSITGSIEEHKDFTIKKLIQSNIDKNKFGVGAIQCFPRLNCKIIGLRSVKGMDGVDFMLNKKEVRLTYLKQDDALEALWLDAENYSSINSIINGQNRCEIIKTIGKGGFSLVYLIRNYKLSKNRIGFGSRLITLAASPGGNKDPEFNKFSRAVEATAFAKSQSAYSHDTHSTAIYALKSMDKALISQFKQADHVMNEKEILSALDHPFIMKMHYSFSTKNYLNLVLDFCPGGELFFHISKHKQFSEGMAKFYIAEVILAIEHLHDKNILYRDLKPENVLIDYDGHIKLTDFGLSAMNFGKHSTADIFCGSPEYMPPEMILRMRYNRMIDFYAIGALLYEMISGIPPFYSAKRKELFHNIITRDVKFYNEYSSAVKDLIRRLLTKDFTKRLGCKHGMVEVKSHPFFAEVNWKKLEMKKIPPPYKPSMREMNFSSEFTSIPVTFNFEEEIMRNERRLSENKSQLAQTPAARQASDLKQSLNEILNTPHESNNKRTFKSKRKYSDPDKRISQAMGLMKVSCAELDNSICFDNSISDLSQNEEEKYYSDQFSKFELPKRSDKKATFVKPQASMIQEASAADDLPFSEVDYESPEVYRKAQIQAKFRNSVRVSKEERERISSVNFGDYQQEFQKRPSRSIGPSAGIDITDLFANAVISERVRKDPREIENRDFKSRSNSIKLFEVVQERLSEESNDDCNVEVEDDDDDTYVNHTRSIPVKAQRKSEESASHPSFLCNSKFTHLVTMMDTLHAEDGKSDEDLEDTFEMPDPQSGNYDPNFQLSNVAYLVRESKAKLCSPKNLNKTLHPGSPSVSSFASPGKCRKLLINHSLSNPEEVQEEYGVRNNISSLFPSICEEYSEQDKPKSVARESCTQGKFSHVKLFEASPKAPSKWDDSVREDTSPGIPQEVHKFKLSNSDSREKTYFKLSARKHYYSGIKMTEMGKVNKFLQCKF
ncbi:unnamed protein product [Moneuplotes crassus]|uniref:Uncharacterized protein n=2 Tax=Euplotes crassus TaxID=5936 RepID=A0AAD1U6T2_EUPCR|nr:unnamed protein product [Moneuplotes crassus]